MQQKSPHGIREDTLKLNLSSDGILEAGEFVYPRGSFHGSCTDEQGDESHTWKLIQGSVLWEAETGSVILDVRQDSL